MSLVYACDRCSAIFDREPGEVYIKNQTYEITKIRRDSMIDIPVHLCPECNESLNKWFNNDIPNVDDVKKSKKRWWQG